MGVRDCWVGCVCRTQAAACRGDGSAGDDDSAAGDLHFPAAVTRGRLTIAVATDGVSPLVSRRIRERVEAEYGEEYDGLLDVLAAARVEARSRIATQRGRRRFYEDVLASDVLDLLRSGKREEARDRVAEMLDTCAGGQA